jgi:hypothetical protein
MDLCVYFNVEIIISGKKRQYIQRRGDMYNNQFIVKQQKLLGNLKDIHQMKAVL